MIEAFIDRPIITDYVNFGPLLILLIFYFFAYAAIGRPANAGLPVAGGHHRWSSRRPAHRSVLDPGGGRGSGRIPGPGCIHFDQPDDARRPLLRVRPYLGTIVLTGGGRLDGISGGPDPETSARTPRRGFQRALDPDDRRSRCDPLQGHARWIVDPDPMAVPKRRPHPDRDSRHPRVWRSGSACTCVAKVAPAKSPCPCPEPPRRTCREC